MTKPENCPSITVLICTLNEAPNLPYVLPGIPDWADEVLLVDGHSTDGTVEVAKQLCPRAKVLYQPGRGKGDALKYGIEQATGDIIVTLDADGSTSPSEIPDFISPLLDGYDFVKGSRFLGRRAVMPLSRRFGNRILAITTNILYGTSYTDVCSGYNAFWKKAWAKIKFPDQFGYEPMILIRAKKAYLKLIEITTIDNGRVNGISKLPNWQQGFGAFKAILREKF